MCVRYVRELLRNCSADQNETWWGSWPRGRLQIKLFLTSIRGRLTSWRPILSGHTYIHICMCPWTPPKRLVRSGWNFLRLLASRPATKLSGFDLDPRSFDLRGHCFWADTQIYTYGHGGGILKKFGIIPHDQTTPRAPEGRAEPSVARFVASLINNCFTPWLTVCSFQQS